MYSHIYVKRSTCTSAALNLLKRTIYAENPDECPYCLFLDDITSECKQEDIERYQIGLQIFKTLFHSKDKSVQIALWNALTRFTSKDYFDKDDFSNDEYFLIMKAVNIEKPECYIFNINKPIETKRLILRPITSKDIAIFKRYYKNDGDFERYCGSHPTKELVDEYASRTSPLLFAIEEKITHNLIGNVGFSVHSECNEVRLEYYIFKSFRHNGYCKEAARILIDRLFDNKLCTPVQTIRDYIYKKKFVKIDTVRAMVATTNEASKKVGQSLGMTHEATLANRMRSADFNWVDEEIYVLTKNQ
jgi:RimJ/RimL family protein N-acetyltransferase